MQRGRQEPTFSVVPEYSSTDGEDAGWYVEQYGLKPDPWQQEVLNAWLARDRFDRYAAQSCGLSVPRQNGKNALLEMRELYGLTANADHGERILHTAHEVRTARKAFLRLASFFEDDRHPELKRLVRYVRRTNGQESIELKNGGSIEFSARSRGAARGYTVDVVVFDEAQELTDEQMDALLPTLSASTLGNRQFVFTGTPPGPNSPGQVFSRIRKEAHDGNDASLSWHEWSVPEIGDVTDKERWYATNPAMGYRISEDFTAKEQATLSPDGFARERLGWWSKTIEQQRETVIDAADWNACKVDDPTDEGIVVYAVKFSPDGSVGTLAACHRPDGGLPFVYVVDSRSMSGGLSWFVDNLAQRRDKAAQVVIDGQSNAQALNDMLLERGMPKSVIRRPSTADVIAANSAFVNAVRERQVTHYGQPALDDSACRSERRRIGSHGGFGFASTDEADATLVEACALAYREAITTKRKPGRKAVVF